MVRPLPYAHARKNVLFAVTRLLHRYDSTNFSIDSRKFCYDSTIPPLLVTLDLMIYEKTLGLLRKSRTFAGGNAKKLYQGLGKRHSYSLYR